MKNIIKGKHYTILCHVEDLKIPHVDPDIFSIVPYDIDA